ncbi:hypothetical protein Poli38472_014834 [Pythium oligandrum]|uniref:D-isomer specific 2-hydroxyacid dehydrogenase catalytic domain-containing protein n=1 Tax=Pythium oligandrum TaxID=41045 RepID=A0A8K1CCQ5_PYTOL|nr:hypothetical protein Poli38472_014834 [Pythium oligandrum]|eukprot:TMW60969.1 hypothetical protein Poli38472_014834 [Pythium oligandrum]
MYAKRIDVEGSLFKFLCRTQAPPLPPNQPANHEDRLLLHTQLRHRVDEQHGKAEGVLPEHQFEYFTTRLNAQTATLAEGCEAVVIFVNDTADAAALRKLHAGGTRLLLLRCAGFDMVDLEVAKELDMPVLRVPAYSPYAAAQNTPPRS